MHYLVLFVTSSSLTLLGLLGILKFFPKWGLMDKPKDYGLTRNPVPYSAGIMIAIIFFTMALLFLPWTKELFALLLAGSLLVGVSFADDFLRLPASLRLLVQALCGAIVVSGGMGIGVMSNPFGASIDLRSWLVTFDLFGQLWQFTPVADIFTIVWLMVVMNAINFQDGIPGLVSGIGSIAALTLFGLSMLLIFSPATTLLEKTNAENIAQMSLILGAILLIFNRFDFFPPKLVIGDSGAMFVGFILAVLSIYAGGKVATTFIVLGLPLADLLWVIIRRISKGQSPFQGDHNHYHHKLLRFGMSEAQTLLVAYACTALFGLTSIGFLFYLKTLGKILVISFIILSMFILSLLLLRRESDVKKII